MARDTPETLRGLESAHISSPTPTYTHPNQELEVGRRTQRQCRACPLCQ